MVYFFFTVNNDCEDMLSLLERCYLGLWVRIMALLLPILWLYCI